MEIFSAVFSSNMVSKKEIKGGERREEKMEVEHIYVPFMFSQNYMRSKCQSIWHVSI